MKRIAVLLLLLTATTAVAQKPITFEDLEAAKRIGSPQLSPDGKWLAFDASTIDLAANARHSAVYLMPSNGGTAKAITPGNKQDDSPVWSPDGKTIAYVSNRETPAKQIFLYDVAAGTSRRISNLDGGAGSLKWAPDGSGLIAVSDIYPDCGVEPDCIKSKNDAAASAPSKGRILTGLLYRHWTAWQEPTRAHILYVPLTGNARDLTPGSFDAPPFSVGGGDEFDISPDGKELVYASNTDKNAEVSTNADLFLVPMSGGTAKRITTRGGADTSPKYSPDGRYIAWRSQARPGYESDLWELWLYDRSNGATRRIGQSLDDPVESLAWAPDSKSLYVTIPEKGRTPIYEVDVTSGGARRVWNEGSADALVVSRDGKTIWFDRSSLTSPTDIYMLTRSAATSVRLTHENDALLSRLALGAPTDVVYIGAEGAQIQAMVVKPPMFDASKKYPAIVLIHGGPQGAWGDSWSYRWNPQMFAAHGYVVFMPNPRGSYGYGHKFLEEISGDWGGKAYTDIMNGVDALASLPYVDGSRIGAAGASYGGYMIDWIMGHTDRFKALVTHDGVYDLKSMYGATEELWFPEWEFRGNPWDNPELYQKWSPDNYVKNFKTPTLVVHSELDYRVPVTQGFELFTALQRRNVPSKMLYFPDEGHWVLKPQNSKLWHATVLGWLDQYLK
jgi:dipeptidyl aminopeptidase/acylaminoacyl peptidase